MGIRSSAQLEPMSSASVSSKLRLKIMHETNKSKCLSIENPSYNK